MSLIFIPKDFEILQILYRYDLSQKNKFSTLGDLLDRLNLNQIQYLKILVDSIYQLLFDRLRSLEVSSELPAGDDSYLDFCSYCLSLPKEHISKLIEDPCTELRKNRILYVKLSGNETYEHEGYLRDAIEGYIQNKFGIILDSQINLDSAFSFLLQYSDFLSSTLFIPKPLNYIQKCDLSSFEN